jgi:hypothetical protein
VAQAFDTGAGEMWRRDKTEGQGIAHCAGERLKVLQGPNKEGSQIHVG